MADHHATNGSVKGKVRNDARFDPTFTQRVVDSMGPKTAPRLREIMTRLIPHLHDFAREVELTVDEWMAGVQLLNWAGQMSTATRNEGQLVCDVVGLETYSSRSLFDEITYQKASEAADLATQSAILGPFFRDDDPIRENGSSIYITEAEGAEEVFIHGKVFDAKTGRPLAKATIDVWQASTNGLYEQQDASQTEHNVRGKFVTDLHGAYSFYTIRPMPYPVPYDGPAAHIHLVVLKEGFRPITTQIFDKGSEYLDNDSVFAVKESLVVEFLPRLHDDKAKLMLNYDIHMAPAGVTLGS